MIYIKDKYHDIFQPCIALPCTYTIVTIVTLKNMVTLNRLGVTRLANLCMICTLLNGPGAIFFPLIVRICH